MTPLVPFHVKSTATNRVLRHGVCRPEDVYSQAGAGEVAWPGEPPEQDLEDSRIQPAMPWRPDFTPRLLALLLLEIESRGKIHPELQVLADEIRRRNYLP